MDARPAELIECGAVTLRRSRAEDLDALLEAVASSVDHLSPWMPWAKGYSREAQGEFLAKAEQNWADGSACNYAITTEGVLAGGISRGGIPRKLGFTEAGRRPLDPPPAAGTGIGVVWELVR